MDDCNFDEFVIGMLKQISGFALYIAFCCYFIAMHWFSTTNHTFTTKVCNSSGKVEKGKGIVLPGHKTFYQFGDKLLELYSYI